MPLVDQDAEILGLESANRCDNKNRFVRKTVMPAFDLYHDAVKRALIKEGWNITHDPLHLR